MNRLRLLRSARNDALIKGHSAIGLKFVFVLLALWAASAPAATLTKLWTYPIGAIITMEDYPAVSEDGQTVVALCAYKATMNCFDAQGTMKWNYIPPKYSSWSHITPVGLAANGDCSRIYYADEHLQEVIVINGQGEDVLRHKLEDRPTVMALSGGGARLYLGYWKGRVECYQTGEKLTRLWTYEAEAAQDPAVRSDVQKIACSRDGGVCAAVLGSRNLVFLDATGKVSFSYPMTGDVMSVAVSGDGSTAAIGTGNINPHEMILLPARLQPGKAISPILRRRFEHPVNSLALTEDASLVFIGLDALSATSFVLMDGKGAELISQNLGAAVERLAINKDGRYLAVVDDIGGENVSFYEVTSGGGLSKMLGTGKTPKGTLPGEPRKATGPVIVLAGLYRVAAIVVFVLVALLLLGVGLQKKKTPMPKVPKTGLAALILGGAGLYLALGLPAMRKEALAGAADAFLLGGILFLIQGIGIWVFALFYRGRFQEVIQKEQRDMRLLAILESRGQVKLDWLAGELGITRKALEEMIYQLVGEKRFRGYIDWKEGDLYAAQAKDIKENHCPHCGAEVEMVGKGVVKCPYCGAETFL
jgi:hypothetical protein